MEDDQLMSSTGHQRQMSDESHSSSLSDCHDYEPKLEFDDTELTTDLEKGSIGHSSNHTDHGNDVDDDDDDDDDDDGNIYVESPVSDGTIEENFEEQLGFRSLTALDNDNDDDNDDDDYLTSASTSGVNVDVGIEAQDFSDIAKYGIVEVTGDDKIGRKVIVISACKLPSNKQFDHDKFYRYLMYTLDQYVENDYSLVYFHHGLTSKNKPPISWLWQIYRAFDRKYKKNLKVMYLVHPTGFIKILWQLFKPAISVKFGKKVMYVNYLYELRQHLRLDQLYIPAQVLEHDKVLMTKNRPKISASQSTTSFQASPVDTQQFKVSFQFLKERNNGDCIPHVVRSCIEYLENPDVLETEGLFRRSANARIVKELQKAYDEGQDVDLKSFSDPHPAAVLVKLWLRELPEPLLTFDLYNDIIEFQRLPRSEKFEVARVLILHRLPDDNYKVFKYIVDFLAKVKERSDLNKMTSSNLAIVFGPNLVWSQNLQATLSSMGPINHFTDYIVAHHEQIFTK